MTAGSYYFVNGFHGNGQRGTRNKIIKNVQKPAFELRQQPEAAPSPKSTRQPYTMAIGHTYWVPQGRSIRNSNRRNSCLMLILYFIFIMLKLKKKKQQRDKARRGRRQHNALSVWTKYFPCSRLNGSRVIFSFSLFHAQAHGTSANIFMGIIAATDP